MNAAMFQVQCNSADMMQMTDSTQLLNGLLAEQELVNDVSNWIILLPPNI